MDQLRVTRPGDLGSIRRVPVWGDAGTAPSVRVRYVALNFKDAMLASGRLPSGEARPFGEPIGREYSGELEDGTRVMGMSLLSVSGAGERLPIESPLEYWPVPDGMSLEAASTIPIAYSTAYVAIVQRGRARRGESVFIHSGAGAVGQAAIRIALNLGLTVFTTVSSEAKVDFLLEQFPSLERRRILDSRSTRFREEILAQTGGRGVDIVLNSFAGDKLRRSLDVLARYGRFVDISRYDVFGDGALPMRAFAKGASYTNFALDEMYRDGHPDLAELHRFMAEGLLSGEIVPLAYTVADDVSEAIARLLKGDTIGKLVLELDAARRSVPVLGAFRCDPHKRVLVTGGLGGIGLELCQWLVERGARHLALVSRSRELTPYQQLRLDRLRRQGVEVTVSEVDLSHVEIADAFVRELERQRPMAGVFHLAMTLRDVRFDAASFEDFSLPVRVKIGIGDALDRATRRHCRELEQFVMFSSVVSFLGNEGQTSYAFGNSALERLCERRRRKGLPGLALQLGAVSDVGFVAHKKLDHALSHLGLRPMPVEGLFDALDRVLPSAAAVVSVYTPFVSRRAATETVRRSLVDVVLAILGFDRALEASLESKTLSELGIDSLMVVEISQVLSRDFGVSLAPRQIRELTLEQVRRLGGEGTVPAPSRARSAAPSIHDVPTAVEGSSVCYYVEGIFLDPELSLALAPAQPGTSYFHVPYHDGVAHVDALAEAFLRHLESLPPEVASVTIAGFSTGAALAAILGQLAREAATNRSITVRGFALPRERYDASRYAPLIELVNAAAGRSVAVTVSEAIASLIAREADPELQREVVALVKRHLVTPDEEGTPLSYRGLLNQLRFMHESRTRLLGALAFDELTVFSDDALSIDRATATALAARVHEIAAPHNSARVVL
jgi:fatty acid synthase